MFTHKELEDLLQSCDYISLNVAETEETKGLLNAQNIPLIKSGAIVISTVPPPIVDTSALADRLSKGDITFISDHPDEMAEEDLNKLKAFPNARLYGPIAFITREARHNMQEIFLNNIRGFLEDKPQNTVH